MTLTLTLAGACDEPGSTAVVPQPFDAARPTPRADSTLSDAARDCADELCLPTDEPSRQDAGRPELDARPEQEPLGADAASAWEPVPPTFSATGETCLGLRELDFACEPERCGPAHYSYVNLSVHPADVTCPGGEGSCPELLSDPQDPFYAHSRSERGYDIVASRESPAVALAISFSADIELARNADEAQRSITYARLSIDLGWQEASWRDVSRNDRPGTTRIEVLDFERRRLHLRAYDTAHLFNGAVIPGFEVCGIEGACLGDGCWWTDGPGGGSGEGPSIELELAFTLPPAEEVAWTSSP
jgi:hypothetical protein